MVIFHLRKSQKSECLQWLLHKPSFLHCCCFSNCPEPHGCAGVCDSRSRRECRTALGCNGAVQCCGVSWISHVLVASFDSCWLRVWLAAGVLQHSVHTGKMITVKMAVAAENTIPCQLCATDPFQNRQLLRDLCCKEHSRAAPVQSEVSWLTPPPAVVFQSSCCLRECWSYLCCWLKCGNAAPLRRAVTKIMLLVKAATC